MPCSPVSIPVPVPPPPLFLPPLPFLEGSYQRDVPLAPLSWLRVGGKADILFKPPDLDSLSHFLKDKPADLPYTVLGVGSNVLIREGGIRGVVIRLTRGFRAFEREGLCVDVGSGLLDRSVAISCCEAGIGGLEFLHTIPGTIGGALRMNAGAYGTEIGDCLVYALALDPKGRLHRLEPGEMDLGYRRCGVPKDWIFVGARLQGHKDTPLAIHQRMKAFEDQRLASQPTWVRTGGSTFANPPGPLKAWELIDQAGCRGLTQGDAQMSPKHCNFLINHGAATADDLETLGEEVRRRVSLRGGVDLRWEIVRLGEFTR